LIHRSMRIVQNDSGFAGPRTQLRHLCIGNRALVAVVRANAQQIVDVQVLVHPRPRALFFARCLPGRQIAVRVSLREQQQSRCEQGFHSAPAFRYLSRKMTNVLEASILLARLVKPCPSSGNTLYSAAPPFARTASTISSLSTFSTRGSFAPCTTRSGARMFLAWNSGEIARCRSPSVAGSPISSYSDSLNEAHQGGMLLSVRTQFITPKMSMPTSKVSGENASA